MIPALNYSTSKQLNYRNNQNNQKYECGRGHGEGGEGSDKSGHVRTRGGGGSRNSKILRTSFMEAPYWYLVVDHFGRF